MVFAVSLSVFDFATNSIAQRIAGADPAVSLSRFVNYPAEARNDKFTLNTNFWAKGVDFSCVSPWNSSCGSLRAGTLISKRHVVFAKHFPLPKGTRIVFVGEDGGVCPCYITKTKGVENADMVVGLLNAEVTPNIHPAKILPQDFWKYIGDGYGLPMGTFDQEEKLLLTVANPMFTNGPPHRVVSSRIPKDPRWVQFREKVIGGDSGNPAFLLIGDTAILQYCLQTGGAGSGNPMYFCRREVQAAMDELCPGYALEVFDFEQVSSEKEGGK